MVASETQTPEPETQTPKKRSHLPMAKYSKPKSSHVLKMHEFKPGQSGNPRGRPPGRKNKNSQRMRKLVRDAMARAGNDVHKEGVLGFLTRVANAHPLEFFQEAVKLEPKLVSAELDETTSTSSTNRPRKLGKR